MGDLYRSEPMQLIQLFIPQEVVQKVVESLGQKELIEFVDVNIIYVWLFLVLISTLHFSGSLFVCWCINTFHQLFLKMLFMLSLLLLIVNDSLTIFSFIFCSWMRVSIRFKNTLSMKSNDWKHWKDNWNFSNHVNLT